MAEESDQMERAFKAVRLLGRGYGRSACNLAKSGREESVPQLRLPAGVPSDVAIRVGSMASRLDVYMLQGVEGKLEAELLLGWAEGWASLSSD